MSNKSVDIGAHVFSPARVVEVSIFALLMKMLEKTYTPLGVLREGGYVLPGG